MQKAQKRRISQIRYAYAKRLSLKLEGQMNQNLKVKLLGQYLRKSLEPTARNHILRELSDEQLVQRYHARTAAKKQLLADRAETSDRIRRISERAISLWSPEIEVL